MRLFYDGIKEGLAKNLALQRTKQQYLEKATATHPFYWGGFVQLGDWIPLELEEAGRSWPFYVGGILVLLLGLIWFWRSRS